MCGFFQGVIKYDKIECLLFFTVVYKEIRRIAQLLFIKIFVVYIYFHTAELMCWLFIEILQVYFSRTEKSPLEISFPTKQTHKQVFICVDEQIYFQDYFIKCTLLFISLIKNVMFCGRCFRVWHMGLESQCVIPLVKLIYETSRFPVSCALH